MNRIKLTNNSDLVLFRHGIIAAEEVRSIELDALVDTGAVMLALPEDVVARLGLQVGPRKKVRDALGRIAEVGLASDLRFEMLGREMPCDAYVLPVGAQPLIGQIQLEALDLIVDARAQEVRVNPEHPDGPILDLLACA
ncbi:MAG TPA: retropepsin-like aspartic protease [Polyangiaceae bacterium]